MGTNNLKKNSAFFRKSRGAVMGDPNEKDALTEAQHPDEELRAETAYNPKYNRIQKEPRPISGLHHTLLPTLAKLDL